MQFIFCFHVLMLILIYSSVFMVSKLCLSLKRDRICGFILSGGVETRCGEVELLHGAASLGAWRSASNLFAVIAVRVYTLESSNSLFYFSHHEGDHLSSCLHFPHSLASGLSRSAQKHERAHIEKHRYKHSTPRFLSEALIHHTNVQPASHRCSEVHERGVYEVLVRMTIAPSHKR